MRPLPDADLSSHDKQFSVGRIAELLLLFQYRNGDITMHERDELLIMQLIGKSLSETVNTSTSLPK